MKIAFDARWIRTSNLDGLGGFALNLLIHLLKIDTNNKYLILFDRVDRRAFIEKKLAKAGIESARYAALSIFPAEAVLKSLFRLPRILNKKKVDIFFSPNYFIPPFFNKYKIVVMVCDLLPLFYPKYLKRACLFLNFSYRFKKLMQTILNRCHLIIALSKEIVKDLNAHLKVNPAKIKQIYPGIESQYFMDPATEEVAITKKIYKLPEYFYLFLGKQASEKNVDKIIAAYATLPANWKEKIKLVIGGVHSSPYARALDILVKKLKLENDVIFPGYIAKNHQPTIMRLAKIFVYPSSYEGFPLKVFEACASRLPVITSEKFRDECQHAVFPVKPTDGKQIKAGLMKISSDANLYSAMQQKGAKLAQQFGWEQTAQKVLYELNQLHP